MFVEWLLKWFGFYNQVSSNGAARNHYWSCLFSIHNYICIYCAPLWISAHGIIVIWNRGFYNYRNLLRRILSYFNNNHHRWLWKHYSSYLFRKDCNDAYSLHRRCNHGFHYFYRLTPFRTQIKAAQSLPLNTCCKVFSHYHLEGFPFLSSQKVILRQQNEKWFALIRNFFIRLKVDLKRFMVRNLILKQRLKEIDIWNEHCLLLNVRKSLKILRVQKNILSRWWLKRKD